MTDTESEGLGKYRDDYGFVFSYEHTPDEPTITLEGCILIARHIAAEEAVKDEKHYVVASTTEPAPAVYALPIDHPMIKEKALTINYLYTPDGQQIRTLKKRPKPVLVKA